MNNIVVYRKILTIGLLALAISLSAQKPTIDLIPSSHQMRESKAIVDTSFALDSMVHKEKYVRPAVIQKENASRENIKKERRQIGPSIDSLLGKPETRKADSSKTTGSLSLYIRKFNPVKFFISIIAFK